MTSSGRLMRWLIAGPVAVAGLWSLGLVVGAGTVPVVGGTVADSSGATYRTSHTLVEEVGRGGYVLACLPLVATILVGVLATLRPRPGPVVAAFVVVGVLGVFNLLAMLTIGIFFVPATAALAVAVAVMLARAAAAAPPRTSAVAEA